MERFVKLVVGGGPAMVTGLWGVEVSGHWSLPWLVGAGLALAGVAVLLRGISVELDADGPTVW